MGNDFHININYTAWNANTQTWVKLFSGKLKEWNITLSRGGKGEGVNIVGVNTCRFMDQWITAEI